MFILLWKRYLSLSAKQFVFLRIQVRNKRSNKRSGTRLKTERETGERRYHRPSVLFLLPHTPYDSYATLYRFLYWFWEKKPDYVAVYFTSFSASNSVVKRNKGYTLVIALLNMFLFSRVRLRSAQYWSGWYRSFKFINYYSSYEKSLGSIWVKFTPL